MEPQSPGARSHHTVAYPGQATPKHLPGNQMVCDLGREKTGHFRPASHLTCRGRTLERGTGFEPATSCLGVRRSACHPCVPMSILGVTWNSNPQPSAYHEEGQQPSFRDRRSVLLTAQSARLTQIRMRFLVPTGTVAQVVSDPRSRFAGLGEDGPHQIRRCSSATVPPDSHGHTETVPWISRGGVRRTTSTH